MEGYIQKLYLRGTHCESNFYSSGIGQRPEKMLKHLFPRAAQW